MIGQKHSRVLPNRLAVLLVCGTALVVRVRAEDVEGFTEPYREIELAAGEPGVLTEVRVQEGSRVAQDELIAALDTDVLQATWELARERSVSDGALQATQAELDLRQTQLDQLRTLRDRGHATQRELERAETDLRIAKARLLMAQEELRMHVLEMKRIETQIAHRQIRSPIDGVVSEVFKEAGEAFVANDPRVATIVQLDPLRARFSTSPAGAAAVSPGESVSLLLPDTQQQLEGRVETISPVMDARSGTVQVVVLIDNSSGEIRSGARCLLRLPTEVRTEQTEP